MHIRAVGNKHTMAHHHINQAGNERERNAQNPMIHGEVEVSYPGSIELS